MLVVVSGLPAVGKSAVAAHLARQLGAVHVSVDPIEDALLAAGLPHSWQTGVAAYEAARAVAGQNLQLGSIVVVDAVNDSEPARNTWRSLSPVFVLLTLGDEDEHRRRLSGRQRGLEHLREPDWTDVMARAAAYEPWADADLIRLAADRPVDKIVTELIARLS